MKGDRLFFFATGFSCGVILCTIILLIEVVLVH